MANGDRALRGIGGWLAFFLVLLAIVFPALAVLRHLLGPTFQSATAPLPRIGSWISSSQWQASTVALAVKVAAQWAIAWRLVRVRRWSSVRIAVAGMWAILCFDIVAHAVIFSGAFVPLRYALVIGAVGRSRAVLFSAIWTAYLLRSRRVRNTYPVHSDADLHAVFE